MGEKSIMILKLIGSLIIVIASSLYGYSISIKYENRFNSIRELQTAIKILESEISFLKSPLPEAFEKVYKALDSDIGRLFLEAKKIYRANRNQSISLILANILKAKYKEINLKPEDRDIVITFLSQLGSSDIDNQINNINHVLYKLKLSEDNALSEKEKNSKLYKSLGLLTGILLVLILL